MTDKKPELNKAKIATIAIATTVVGGLALYIANNMQKPTNETQTQIVQPAEISPINQLRANLQSEISEAVQLHDQYNGGNVKPTVMASEWRDVADIARQIGNNQTNLPGKSGGTGYDQLIRAQYNLADILINAKDFDSAIRVAQEGIDTIYDTGKQVGPNQQKYDSSLYYLIGQAYARSDSSMERGTQMFVNFFEAMLEDGNDTNASRDIVQGAWSHRNAAQKFQKAMSAVGADGEPLFDKDEKERIRQRLYSNAQGLLTNSSLSNEGRSAISTFKLDQPYEQ